MFGGASGPPSLMTPLMGAAMNHAINTTESTCNVRLLIMADLEDSLTPQTTPASIDTAWLFNAGTLFVTKKVGSMLDKHRKKIYNIEESCGGDTTVGNAIFFEVMKPLLARVRKAARAGDYEGMFGDLFAATTTGCHWINDNECWMENAFPKFFAEFSECWRSALQLPEAQLGLVNLGAPQGLNNGVLLQRVVAHVQRWQENANNVLSDMEDAEEAGKYKGKTAMVTIF